MERKTSRANIYKYILYCADISNPPKQPKSHSPISRYTSAMAAASEHLSFNLGESSLPSSGFSVIQGNGFRVFIISYSYISIDDGGSSDVFPKSRSKALCPTFGILGSDMDDVYVTRYSTNLYVNGVLCPEPLPFNISTRQMGHGLPGDSYEGY